MTQMQMAAERKSAAQLQHAKLEHKARRFFRLNLELKAKQLNFPRTKDAPRFIRVDVTWSNPSNWVSEDRQVLDFSTGEFKLVRLDEIKPDGVWVGRGPERTLHLVAGRGDRIVRTMLAVGDSASAIQMVTAPGLYMIWIHAKLAADWEPRAVTFVYVK